MQIIQFILIVGLFILFSYSVGQIVLYKEYEISVEKIVLKSIVGFFSALAIFQIVCVPMIFMHIRFSQMAMVISIIYVLLFIVSIVMITKNKNQFYIENNIYKSPKLYLLFFFVLLGVQVYFALFYEIGWASTDDFVYVVESTATIEDDSMYLTHEITGEIMKLNPNRALNSYNVFLAYLAVVTGTHTTVMAHSILPVFLLLLSYGVYYLLANCFCEREEIFVYLSILSLLNIFGGYSIYSFSYRLLGPIWQGKAVAMILVLPFLFWLLPRMYTKEFKLSNCALLVIVVLAICSCTLTGAGMALMVIGGLGLLYLVKYRYFKNFIYIASGCFIAGLHVLLYLVLR